jgi:hypothetical protein
VPARQTRRFCTGPTPSGPAPSRATTVTTLLTDEQLARYQPWFDNTRRLKDLVSKLEIVSLQALETADQLTAETTRSSTPSRKRRKAQG